MKDVSLGTIDTFREMTASSPLDHAITNALTKHNVKDIAFTNRGLDESQFQFSVEIPTMAVTNQKQSGRCWIFAALNVFREKSRTTATLKSSSSPRTIPLSGISSKRSTSSTRP
jgi:aminopeptidase C